MFWMLLPVLWAAPGEALEGSWVLEPARSEPIDPLLEALGVSWLERRAAERLVPEQDIAVAADGQTVTITSRPTPGATGTENTLRVDGQLRPSVGMPGFETARHDWEADGSLVTVMRGQAPDGAPMTAVVSRGLDGSGVLVQQIYLEVDREEPYTLRVNRVFRRK